MAHNDVYLINPFIRQLLAYEGSFVFIHIDEKGLDIFSEIIDDKRVFVIPEHYNGSWGDYTQIQMVNALITYAHAVEEFDYYSLHSGVDLCVRPIQELALFLGKQIVMDIMNVIITKPVAIWRRFGESCINLAKIF